MVYAPGHQVAVVTQHKLLPVQHADEEEGRGEG